MHPKPEPSRRSKGPPTRPVEPVAERVVAASLGDLRRPIASTLTVLLLLVPSIVLGGSDANGVGGLASGSTVLSVPTDGCTGDYRKGGEGDYWTPIVVAHAPANGTGEAGRVHGKAHYFQAAVQGDTWVQVQGARTSSSVEHQDIKVDNGKTAGAFRLARWEWGTTTRVCVQRGDQYTTYRDDVFVSEWKDSIITHPLEGASTSTDEDDVEHFTHNDIPSLTFKNRWTEHDGKIEHKGSGTYTTTYRDQESITVGGAIAFGDKKFNLLFEYKYTEDHGQYGSIVFRNGEPICVSLDRLGGDGARPAFRKLTAEECADPEFGKRHSADGMLKNPTQNTAANVDLADQRN